MIVFRSFDEAKGHVGREIGPSEWVLVDQAMIDRFAEATGDFQWIHVDVERARAEMPEGRTIAHGFLTLSLLPRLIGTLTRFENVRQSINYGTNKVRFTHPVPAGSRVRLRQAYAEVVDVPGNGIRITADCTVDIDGRDRPALVAQMLSLVYA